MRCAVLTAVVVTVVLLEDEEVKLRFWGTPFLCGGGDRDGLSTLTFTCAAAKAT